MRAISKCLRKEKKKEKTRRSPPPRSVDFEHLGQDKNAHIHPPPPIIVTINKEISQLPPPLHPAHTHATAYHAVFLKSAQVEV